jgi:hypothetical protein
MKSFKKFLFSRLHFSGMFGEALSSDDLLNDLKSIEGIDGFIESSGYGWYFRDISSENIEGIDYIFGWLDKISLNKNEIVVDKDTKEENVETIENVKLREGFFIMKPSKNIVAFESCRFLTKNQFKQAFEEGYEQIMVGYAPEFDFLFDEAKLFEDLANLKEAYSAKFDLKTTNPDARKDFEKIDNLFQATNSEVNKMHLAPKKGDTLDIDNTDSLVRQGLAMSAAGYGSGTVAGKDINGNSYVIKTGERNLETIEISETKTLDEVKKLLIIKFDKLTDR